MIQSYRDLDVWKKSIAMVKSVYQICASFPKNEQYGLTSQIQCSAVSVAANIAEGRSRQSTLEVLLSKTNEIGKMINGLVRSLENKNLPDPRPPIPEPSKTETA